MRWCKHDEELQDFHERELKGFMQAREHRELSIAQSLCYCAEEGICPPTDVVRGAAALICDLLVNQKCSRRGRNAGPLERFQQDQWDLERWDAVLEIRRLRKNVSNEFEGVMRHLRETKRALATATKSAKNSTDPKIKNLQNEIAYFQRRLTHNQKWKRWLKSGVFECASRYLVGRDARAGAHAVRASFYKVQKALDDPVERTRYPIFEDRFLKVFGFPGLQDVKPGTKSFPLYRITN